MRAEGKLVGDREFCETRITPTEKENRPHNKSLQNGRAAGEALQTHRPPGPVAPRPRTGPLTPTSTSMALLDGRSGFAQSSFQIRLVIIFSA